jgi:hypothetical protein
MTWLHVFWDFGPGGNAEHVADHGLDMDEVEHVLRHPEKHKVSRCSGRPLLFGHTPAGEYSAAFGRNQMNPRIMNRRKQREQSAGALGR